MKRIISISMFLIITLGISASLFARDSRIQMAILLDTSSSMDGLIDQAKSQLWKIVNELALAKKDGQTPVLEVALYEYGNDNLARGEGYIRMVTPLTTDLDRVSEELFRLTTNGGSEYCGMVIDSAVRGLNWSKKSSDLKVIYIAGNEPFSQGQLPYAEACRRSIRSGVIVNTIFCGDYRQGINTDWKRGADLADGTYLNIDHNSRAVYIPAPQDDEIKKLGRKLNSTYIAYGRKGIAYKARQKEQDKKALSMSEESAVQRSIAKSSSHYRNSGWDLVDALKKGSVKMESIKHDELPEEMKNMSEDEKKKYIDNKLTERKQIQEKLQKLNVERKKFIEKEMKKRSEKNTLDQAILSSIRKQAEKKSYRFK